MSPIYFPAVFFVAGCAVTAALFLLVGTGGRRPRSIDPPIAPYRGPGRRAGDAGKIVDTARSDRQVDASIAEYERHRSVGGYQPFVSNGKIPEPPRVGSSAVIPRADDEALRRVHAMEQAPKFEHDMQCPECGAVAPAGSRAVIHLLQCSEKQDLERML
jgi:hypothetical protein